MKRTIISVLTAGVLACLCLGCAHQKTGATNEKQRVRSNTEIRLQELIRKGQTVSLGLYVSDVKYICPHPQNVLQKWEATTRELLIENHQNQISRLYMRFPNFSMVDKYRLRNIITELQVSQIILADDETKMEIVELTGMTHLFDMQAIRFCHGETTTDTTVIKLLDMNNDLILAVDIEKQFRKLHESNKKWEVIKREFNGREIILDEDTGMPYYK